MCQLHSGRFNNILVIEGSFELFISHCLIEKPFGYLYLLAPRMAIISRSNVCIGAMATGYSGILFLIRLTAQKNC